MITGWRPGWTSTLLSGVTPTSSPRTVTWAPEGFESITSVPGFCALNSCCASVKAACTSEPKRLASGCSGGSAASARMKETFAPCLSPLRNWQAPRKTNVFPSRCGLNAPGCFS